MKKAMAEKLQLQPEAEVERAHRTGKPGGDRTRPIVLKVLMPDLRAARERREDEKFNCKVAQKMSTVVDDLLE